MIPLIDLHCDLLRYLEKNPHGTIFDPISRASYLQMREGGVKFQTMAVFSLTEEGSSNSGLKQLEIFNRLLLEYPEYYYLGFNEGSGIGVLPAIENLSGLVEESEPLDLLFDRLNALCQKVLPIYVSMTWNTENRFGGGNAANCGLKADGKAVLDFLHEKKIAIDLSHTCDALAFDILNYIEQKNLTITPIASHSNFRSIIDHARNLPDELVLQIIRKGGVIGLNFVLKFIGEDLPQYFFKQIDYALSIGAEDSLCFGADFFFDGDSPNLDHLKPFFHNRYGSASCYQMLLNELKSSYNRSLLEKICFKNFQEFFKVRGSACSSLAI